MPRRTSGRHAGPGARTGAVAAALAALVAVAVPVSLAAAAEPPGATAQPARPGGDTVPGGGGPHRPSRAELEAQAATRALLTWALPRNQRGITGYRVGLAVQYPADDGGWSPRIPWQTRVVASSVQRVTLCTRTPGVRMSAFVQTRHQGRWSRRTLARPVVLPGGSTGGPSDTATDTSGPGDPSSYYPTTGPTLSPPPTAPSSGAGTSYYTGSPTGEAPTGPAPSWPTYPSDDPSGYYPLTRATCLMYEYG